MKNVVQFQSRLTAKPDILRYGSQTPHFAGAPMKPTIPRAGAHTQAGDAREGQTIPVDARTEQEVLLWNAYVSALTLANRTLKFEDGRAAAIAFQQFVKVFCAPEDAAP